MRPSSIGPRALTPSTATAHVGTAAPVRPAAQQYRAAAPACPLHRAGTPSYPRHLSPPNPAPYAEIAAFMDYSTDERSDLVSLSLEPRPVPASPDPLTPSQKSQAAFSAVLKLIALGCAFFTVILLLLSAWFILGLHHTLATRPHATARVLSTQIYSRDLRISGNRGVASTSTIYGFRCTVVYQVAFIDHQAQADIGYQKGNEAEIQRWSDRIRAGDQIEIVYSPSDPSRVRFAGDFTIAYAPALLLLRWIAWLAAFGTVAAVLSKKLRPPPPPDGDQSTSFQP